MIQVAGALTHAGDMEADLSFRLQPGTALATVAIWGTNQWIKDLFSLPPLSLCNPAFQKKIYTNTKKKCGMYIYNRIFSFKFKNKDILSFAAT